jgi:hypothetical protein
MKENNIQEVTMQKRELISTPCNYFSPSENEFQSKFCIYFIFLAALLMHY